MRRLFFFILLLIIYCINVLSQPRIEVGPGYNSTPIKSAQQDTLDNTLFRCYYKMLWVKDAENPTQKTENEMLLQVGKTVSKFFDRQKYLSDSLMQEYAKQQMDGIDAMNKILGRGVRPIAISIFKNYPEGKITTIDRIPFDSYLYEEELPTYEWTLSSDTTTVCGYLCKKATSSIFGRNYTAWYTPEIPTDNGPWKFGGLPGLILKIEDDQGHYLFECIGIEKPTWSDPIYFQESKSRFNITKKRFLDAQRKYHENPSGKIENSGMIQSSLPVSASKARPYNPIELSD